MGMGSMAGRERLRWHQQGAGSGQGLALPCCPTCGVHRVVQIPGLDSVGSNGGGGGDVGVDGWGSDVGSKCDLEEEELRPANEQLYHMLEQALRAYNQEEIDWAHDAPDLSPTPSSSSSPPQKLDHRKSMGRTYTMSAPPAPGSTPVHHAPTSTPWSAATAATATAAAVAGRAGVGAAAGGVGVEAGAGRGAAPPRIPAPFGKLPARLTAGGRLFARALEDDAVLLTFLPSLKAWEENVAQLQKAWHLQQQQQQQQQQGLGLGQGLGGRGVDGGGIA
ncbi:unnamed protein product, partial [Discosporangium mesarthrocarpum]